MKMRSSLIIATLLFWLCLFPVKAQEIKSDKEILNTYAVTLQLNESQITAFKTIYLKIKNDLQLDSLNNNEFNATVKSRDNQFFKLLTADQFRKYKKLRAELEPELDFKFN